MLLVQELFNKSNKSTRPLSNKRSKRWPKLKQQPKLKKRELLMNKHRLRLK